MTAVRSEFNQADKNFQVLIDPKTLRVVQEYTIKLNNRIKILVGFWHPMLQLYGIFAIQNIQVCNFFMGAFLAFFIPPSTSLFA